MSLRASQNPSRANKFQTFWPAMKIYDDLTYPKWVDSLNMLQTSIRDDGPARA